MEYIAIIQDGGLLVTHHAITKITATSYVSAELSVSRKTIKPLGGNSLKRGERLFILSEEELAEALKRNREIFGFRRAVQLVIDIGAICTRVKCENKTLNAEQVVAVRALGAYIEETGLLAILKD